MTINSKEIKKITMTIKMKNGTVYEKKRIPNAPFGQSDKLVSFWIGEGIMKVVPWIEVKECTLFNVPE